MALPIHDLIDAQLDASIAGEWPLPFDTDIDDQWRDAFIATRLADVISRRHYGVPFKQLSVEDRCVVRGECESFVLRFTWIMRKRK